MSDEKSTRIPNPAPKPPAPEPFKGRIKPDGTKIPHRKPKAPRAPKPEADAKA